MSPGSSAIPVESVQHLIQERGHRLEAVVSAGMKRLEGRPGSPRADPDQSPRKRRPDIHRPGGRIRLSAEPEADRVVIRVEDNGSGISRERLSTIFEPFSPGRTYPGSNGRRIGDRLTIVKSMVELHGGTVTASSPGPATGGVFTVCLPVPRCNLCRWHSNELGDPSHSAL